MEATTRLKRALTDEKEAKLRALAEKELLQVHSVFIQACLHRPRIGIRLSKRALAQNERIPIHGRCE